MSKAIIKEYLKDKSEEVQYIDLIKDILENGTVETGRNGTTKVIIGNTMYFSLENKRLPLLTTKKVAWKTCLKELLWFINGETSNKLLQEQNVKIWNDNASRDFLDSRGLHKNKEGDLGPIYGFQWRHFNADYGTCDDDYTGTGTDQLQWIIDQLKNPETRNSRRLIMTAWNPAFLNQMALPPCHILSQFCVTEKNKLSCILYQRSGDTGLGVPFNIASYSILTHLIAKHTGLVAHEFVYNLGNAHIYDDHYERLTEQIERQPYAFPTLNIDTLRDNINDYEVDDFKIENYNFHPPIKMDMRK
jgi:thymidylate synthase